MPGRKRVNGDDRPIPSNFINAWRKHRGLTLEQLAGEAGLSVSTVSQVERTVQDVTGRTLVQIGKALNVKVGDLLSMDPREEADPDALRMAYDELNDEDKPLAIQVVRALKRLTPSPQEVNGRLDPRVFGAAQRWPGRVRS